MKKPSSVMAAQMDKGQKANEASNFRLPVNSFKVFKTNQKHSSTNNKHVSQHLKWIEQGGSLGPTMCKINQQSWKIGVNQSAGPGLEKKQVHQGNGSTNL